VSDDTSAPNDPQTPPTADPDDGDKRSVGKQLFDEITGIHVDWRTALLVPALSLLTALIVGAFIIAFTDLDFLRGLGEDPLGAIKDVVGEIGSAYAALFTGSVGSLRAISETLTAASPLILAGLAVGLGFRAGLFNIGAEGQMIIGGVTAAMVGFTLDLSFLGDFAVVVHLPLALLGGIVGGAVWGGVPGLLRAKTGAHEVITTIMLNNIAIRLLDWLLKTSLIGMEGRDDPVSKAVDVSARLPRLLGFLEGSRPASDIRVHAGIIVALLAAAFVFWLLFKSTLGYEFRAVGYNPDAARYAGMSVTWTYVLVMAISGALAGLAGASQSLGVLYRVTPGFTAGIGFEAISLALLGRSHPVGIVAAGLLFGALRAGGQEMQVQTDIPIDLILVIQALVVVFIAAPALIRAIYRVKTGEGAEQLTKGWAT
jgi:simple sugar transport system permease protein